MTKILIVDDSLSMRNMIMVTLNSKGYEIVIAVDGEDGLKKAQNEQFDCVLTDIHMPNKDGLSFVRDLRGMPGYKFIPILILTTDSNADRKQDGRNAGATGWLVKPFNPSALIKTIEKVLS